MPVLLFFWLLLGLYTDLQPASTPAQSWQSLAPSRSAWPTLSLYLIWNYLGLCDNGVVSVSHHSKVPGGLRMDLSLLTIKSLSPGQAGSSCSGMRVTLNVEATEPALQGSSRMIQTKIPPYCH